MSNTMNAQNTVSLPEFTLDTASLIQMRADATASADGTTLYTGIAAIRNGEVEYRANASGEGYGWKGVNKAAATYEMSNSEMSKITKIVNGLIPDVLVCDLDEVRDHVLMFLNTDSVHSGYEKVQAAAAGVEPTAKVWSLQDMVDTLCRKATKEGLNVGDVVRALADAQDRGLIADA